jgi:hypothetical protein
MSEEQKSIGTRVAEKATDLTALLREYVASRTTMRGDVDDARVKAALKTLTAVAKDAAVAISCSPRPPLAS